MRQRLVRIFRLSGLAAAAFWLAVCLPLAHAQAERQVLSQTPEPRFGEAPAGDATLLQAASEDNLLAAVQAELATADAEFSNIRKALDVLGPLPDHPDLFIPFTLDEPAPQDLAQLYAVAPKFDRSSSLFHRAEFGSFASQQAAEDRWRALIETSRLVGLAPAYADVGGEIRLTVGPLSSAGEVEALCVELAALTGLCRGIAPVRAW